MPLPHELNSLGQPLAVVVIGGVVGGERADAESMVEPGVKRPVSSKSKSVFQIGQADEHEREQRFGVPLIVEQDMQMVEGILVKQVCLVDEKDGADPLFGKVLDVRVDGEEQVAGGIGLGQTESEAEMAVEVAPSDGAVLAVDEAEVGRGEGMAQCAQDARFSDSWLAGEHGAGVHGVGEVFDQGEFGRREPELGVTDVFGERLGGKTEVREVVEAHGRSSLLGVRPSDLSSRALGGSNVVRASWGESRHTRGLWRWAFLQGSTGCRTWRLPSCSIQGGSAGSIMQRETVTSLRARKPTGVSQSSPSIGRVESARTRRRT